MLYLQCSRHWIQWWKRQSFYFSIYFLEGKKENNKLKYMRHINVVTSIYRKPKQVSKEWRWYLRRGLDDVRERTMWRSGNEHSGRREPKHEGPEVGRNATPTWRRIRQLRGWGEDWGEQQVWGWRGGWDPLLCDSIGPLTPRSFWSKFQTWYNSYWSIL